ncbi:MAG TPA: EAL domain-containing protein [Bryobacteraceae bacterium]|nr:EAL domain-containing protein [Bryobacteraceae bacterium]
MFQPIVDTAGYRILAHHCDVGMVDVAIRAAAALSTDGLYLIRTCSENPRCHAIREATRLSGLPPANIVFEIPISVVVREPNHWASVCDEYRQSGFGIALAGAGSIPRTLRIIRDLRPDYIKLDRMVIRHIERLSCAMTVRGLADLAEEWGGRVIADGVERLLVVENLWLLDVYLMQGALLGKGSPQLARNDSADLVSLAQALSVGNSREEPVHALGASGSHF